MLRQDLITASRLLPLGKDGGGVRPIAVKETFYKLATIYPMSLVKPILPDIFEPIQLGVGARGGSERAVHLVQTALETMGDETVLLKTDIRNAFNSRRRDQMLEILFEHPELAPIWRMAYWAYKDSSSLLVFEERNNDNNNKRFYLT